MKTDTIYKFRIEPSITGVNVEVYKIIKLNGSEYERNLIDKSFGSFFRPINDKDYAKAKDWGHNQLVQIYHANKDQ